VLLGKDKYMRYRQYSINIHIHLVKSRIGSEANSNNVMPWFAILKIVSPILSQTLKC
jgi:hypothetical protein